MSDAARLILELNVWAVLVWAAASLAARRAPSLAAWPAYWLGALGLIAAPVLLAPFAPAAPLLAVADPAAFGRAAGWAYDQVRPLMRSPELSLLAGAAEIAPAVLPDASVSASASASASAAYAPAASAGFAQSAPMAFADPSFAAESAETAAPVREIAREIPWGAMAAAALAIYAAGALAFGARCMAACGRIRAAARRASRLDAASPYPALVTGEPLPPCALGLPAPRILVPARLLPGLSAEQLDMILRHEAAHIRRRDPEMTALLGLCAAAFWINPAVAALVARWREAAEIAADAAVAADQPREARVRYARLLISALRETGGAPLAAPAAELRLDHKGSVKTRLSAILTPERPGGGAAKFAAVSAGALLAAAGAMASAALAAPQAAPLDVKEVVEDSRAEPVEAAAAALPADLAGSDPAAEAEPRPVTLADAGEASAARAPVRIMPAPPPAPPAPAPEIVMEAAEPPAYPDFHPGMSREEREAFREEWEDAQADWEEAQAEWRREWEQAVAEREEAIAEAQREREDALVEAERERRRAIAEAERDREEALADAEQERRAALAEARAAREEALAEGERAREEALNAAHGEDWEEMGRYWTAVGRQFADYGAEHSRAMTQMGRLAGQVGRMAGRVGQLEGRLAALSARPGVSQDRIDAAQEALDDARDELAALERTQEREMARLEAELERIMAEAPEPPEFDFHYSFDGPAGGYHFYQSDSGDVYVSGPNHAADDADAVLEGGPASPSGVPPARITSGR